MRAEAVDDLNTAAFHHSRQAESCRPHYISLLHHTVLAWASSLVHLAHCSAVFLGSLDVEIYVDDSLVRPPTWSTWRTGQSNSLQHVIFIVMIVIDRVY